MLQTYRGASPNFTYLVLRNALWGNDFTGSVFARRHLMKLILDKLLRQRDSLIIYNKIEQVFGDN